MTDIAALSIKVDYRDVTSASHAMTDLTKKGEELERGFGKMRTASTAFGRETKDSVDGLSASLSALVKIYAALNVVQKVGSSTLLASRYDTLGVAMEQVGKIAGYSTTQMALYQEQLERTGISSIEARQNLARLAIAHIDLSKAADLGRVSQQAAVIKGINSSEAFNNITYGIISGQVRVLRTMGIMVNFQQAYVKAIREKGAALTEDEKMQVRFNLVMEEGSKRAGVYEESMKTVGKQITTLPRYIENLSVSFGKLFQEPLRDGVTWFSEFLVSSQKWLDQNKGYVEEFSQSLGLLTKGVGSLVNALTPLTSILSSLSGTLLQNAAKGIGLISASISDVINNITGKTSSGRTLSEDEKLEAFNRTFKTPVALRKSEYEKRNPGQRYEDFIKTYEKESSNIDKFLDGIEKANEQIAKAKVLEQKIKVTEDYIATLTQSISNMESVYEKHKTSKKPSVIEARAKLLDEIKTQKGTLKQQEEIVASLRKGIEIDLNKPLPREKPPKDKLGEDEILPIARRKTEYEKIMDQLEQDILKNNTRLTRLQAERVAFEEKVRTAVGAPKNISLAMQKYDQAEQAKIDRRNKLLDEEMEYEYEMTALQVESRRLKEGATSMAEDRNREYAAYETALNIVKPYRKELQELGKTYEDLVLASEAGIISQQQFAKAEDELILQTQKTLSLKFSMVGEFRDTFWSWSKSTTDAIVETAFGASNAWSNMVDSMIKDMLRLVAQKNIVDPLFGQLAGWLNASQFVGQSVAVGVGTSIDTGSLAGVGGGSSVDWGSGFGSLFGPGRASGGDVYAGQSYLVGEKGRAELFVPSTHGSVLSGASAGQTTVNTSITINVQKDGNTSSAATSQEGVDLAKQLEPIVNQLIMKNMRPRGLLSKGA